MLIYMILSLFVVILSMYYFNWNWEMFFLMVLMCVTCFSCFYVNNMFIIFLLMELQTFCILIILGSVNNLLVNIMESGLKYLILSSMISVLFLLSMFTGYVNEMNLYVNNFILAGPTNFKFIEMMIFLCLCFKFGFVPFHLWLLDMYESCSWWILSVMVTIPKLTYLFMIYSLNLYENFMICFGLMCLFFGSMGAMNQIKMKSFLGYSSMTHSGFIIYCLLLPENMGFKMGFLYFFIYVHSFLVLMYFLMKTNMSSKITNFAEIKTMNNYFVFMLLISIFTISGFPPFSGFITKYMVIYNFFEYNYYFVVMVLVVFSIISMIYYLNLMKYLYFSKSKNFHTWISVNSQSNGYQLSHNLEMIPYYSFFLLLLLFLNPDIVLSFLYCF